MKRIGVDMHTVDGIFHGVRTHILEIFSEVIQLSPDLHFVLFLDNFELLRSFSPVFSGDNVELVRLPPINPMLRLCWQLPSLQRKYQLDLIHTQYILPIPNICKGIVTIHDILFETHPQYFEWFFRIRSKVLMRLSAWQAAHVLTVSEFSRQAMHQYYRVPTEKISVIYNAADTQRFFPGEAGQATIANRGLQSKGYILTVGRLEPRKNHVTLLRSFAALSSAHTLPLVIIGQKHFGFDEVFAVIQTLRLEGRVFILSDVSDDELPAFYRHARFFVYPSWAEGFGMPPIEAMASGTAVICSDSTSIPEVVGDAALLVNPGDELALTAALERLISDDDMYEQLIERGLKQVQKFQWRESAETLRRIYLEQLQSKAIEVNASDNVQST